MSLGLTRMDNEKLAVEAYKNLLRWGGVKYWFEYMVHKELDAQKPLDQISIRMLNIIKERHSDLKSFEAE